MALLPSVLVEPSSNRSCDHDDDAPVTTTKTTAQAVPFASVSPEPEGFLSREIIQTSCGIQIKLKIWNRRVLFENNKGSKLPTLTRSNFISRLCLLGRGVLSKEEKRKK